jgi:hypothetical protein
MNTLDIRHLILSTPLREEPVTVAGWESANLVIRELDGKRGAELIAACTDTSGNVNQEALVAGIVLATLRNADDPQKALIFCSAHDPNTYDPALRDSLMATGLGRIMHVATQSIKLSGLDAAAVKEAKNG